MRDRVARVTLPDAGEYTFSYPRSVACEMAVAPADPDHSDYARLIVTSFGT